MSNIETISNDQKSKTWSRPSLGRLRFRTHFAFRISHFAFRRNAAFTIIELLVVIALIIVLAGLVFSTIGYVQSKAARSRAETEIAAMSAALENYKSDNGIYPTDPTKTASL